jgi:hypothetical protein
MKYNLFSRLLLAEKIVQYSQEIYPFWVVAIALDIPDNYAILAAQNRWWA